MNFVSSASVPPWTAEVTSATGELVSFLACPSVAAFLFETSSEPSTNARISSLHDLGGVRVHLPIAHFANDGNCAKRDGTDGKCGNNDQLNVHN